MGAAGCCWLGVLCGLEGLSACWPTAHAEWHFFGLLFFYCRPPKRLTLLSLRHALDKVLGSVWLRYCSSWRSQMSQLPGFE